MDRWQGLTRRISRRTLLARGAALAAGVTFGGVLSGAQARPNPARVFNHVNVIPMDRAGVLWDQAVLVADGLVRAVAPAMTRVPEGIVTIPAGGRFLMPGLADMHLHLASPADLLVLLANGVTTVRDMSGTPDKLAWKRAVAAGSMPGPTIHVASSIVDGVPPVFDDLLTASTPATGRSLVDRFAADGYEFVKVYSELRYEVLVAMVERARLHGLRVVGHCWRRSAWCVPCLPARWGWSISTGTHRSWWTSRHRGAAGTTPSAACRSARSAWRSWWRRPSPPAPGTVPP